MKKKIKKIKSLIEKSIRDGINTDEDVYLRVNVISFQRNFAALIGHFKNEDRETQIVDSRVALTE